MDRLKNALELLGYQAGQQPNVRSNLLHAIMLFAASQQDADLESACEAELKNVRAVAAAA